MKKISVYVSNQELKPSNYYRIVQYCNYISGTRIYNIYNTKIFELLIKHRDNRLFRKILEFILKKSANHRIIKYIKKDLKDIPDYVIVQKSMTKYNLCNKAKRLLEKILDKTTLIWDFDDNIYEDKQINEDEYILYCKKAKHIIVVNSYLKETLPPKCKRRIKELYTSDIQMYIGENKLEELTNNRLKNYDNSISLIWLATSANLKYLMEIIPALEYSAKVLKIKYNKELILKVVCDKELNIKSFFLKIENIKWTREIAIQTVLESNIGIMPLKESNHTLGKGGFKLIQYISTGLPVISSNVGYNKEIFKDDIGYLIKDDKNISSWADAIVSLSINKDKWIKCSNNALKVWEDNFNAYDVLEYWKSILK